MGERVYGVRGITPEGTWNESYLQLWKEHGTRDTLLE